MKIFRWIYTIWAALVFLFAALIGVFWFTLSSLLPRRTAVGAMISYNVCWSKFFAFLTGSSYRVYGREKLQKEGAYIFACNHTGSGDIFITNIALRRPFCPLGKAEARKIPIIGYVFSKVMVFVDRSNPESRRKSLVELAKVVEQGISVLIFPEGTRNRTGNPPLLPFKSGAFRLAIEAQIPLVPMVITGVRDLLPNERPPLRPAAMSAYFGDPIETKGMTEQDINALKEQAYKVMNDLLLKYEQQK